MRKCRHHPDIGYAESSLTNIDFHSPVSGFRHFISRGDQGLSFTPTSHRDALLRDPLPAKEIPQLQDSVLRQAIIVSHGTDSISMSDNRDLSDFPGPDIREHLVQYR